MTDPEEMCVLVTYTLTVSAIKFQEVKDVVLDNSIVELLLKLKSIVHFERHSSVQNIIIHEGWKLTWGRNHDFYKIRYPEENN